MNDLLKLNVLGEILPLCTMLANHSTNLKHNFDVSNPKILDKEHNLEKKINLRNDRNFKQQKFD